MKNAIDQLWTNLDTELGKDVTWGGLEVANKNENRAVGQIEGGWAYEMDLQRQNGCWVVAQLRVFPESDDLKLDYLLGITKLYIDIGSPDGAAVSARQLAHFALTRPHHQDLPVPLPPGGLTARHLRRIPFRKNSRLANLNKLDALWMGAAKNHRRHVHMAGRMVQHLRRQVDRLMNRRPGRVDRGDGRLAHIASCYVEALNRGSRRQNADVARQLGMKISQVRDAIHLARRKGLLSSTRQQGVPGGELTPRGVAFLQVAENKTGAKKP